VREVFGGDLGHTEADRRKSAMRNSRLCKLLSDQGLTVVIATISLFHDCQKWNRKQMPGYREVFVSVPLEVLKQRDPKKIYKIGSKKNKANIVGLDIAAQIPKKPDVTVINDGTRSPREVAKQILNHFLTGKERAA